MQNNNNPNLVFDNDPFNHIDIFSFSDFDCTENLPLPKPEEINNLRIQSGHLSLLNPTILKENDIENQLDLAMKIGIVNTKEIKNNNKQPIKTTDKKIATRTTTTTNKTTKKDTEKESATDKKLQPKKRGRKSTTTKTSKNEDTSEEECNVKLPQKFQYLEEKEKSGTLTEEDEKILKKERRLIKNRESAQQFRKRQKMHTIELQDKVDKLTDDNVHLKHTVDSLNKDKEQLEIQIKNLWQFVNKAFTFAVPYRVEQQNNNNNYHNSYLHNHNYNNYPPPQLLLNQSPHHNPLHNPPIHPPLHNHNHNQQLLHNQQQHLHNQQQQNRNNNNSSN